MSFILTDDPLVLFRVETSKIISNSSTCSESNYTSLEAFRVDLFLARDTPDDGTGSYPITLVAEVIVVLNLICNSKKVLFVESLYPPENRSSEQSKLVLNCQEV